MRAMQAAILAQALATPEALAERRGLLDLVVRGHLEPRTPHLDAVVDNHEAVEELGVRVGEYTPLVIGCTCGKVGRRRFYTGPCHPVYSVAGKTRVSR